MVQLACEAKTKFRPFNRALKFPISSGDNVHRDSHIISEWIKYEFGARNKKCNFEWKVTKGEEYQQPRYYLEADCKQCTGPCQPVYYYLNVRINEPSNKHWKKVRITVAYVHSARKVRR